jgi:hypothetical protein
MYSIAAPPAVFGSRATVFFCDPPTNAVVPLADVMTPTLICADTGSAAASSASASVPTPRAILIVVSPPR